MIARAHVIGMGRLGRPLADRLESMNIAVERWGRQDSGGVRGLSHWPERQTGDAVFLALPDDSIEQVANRLKATLSPDAVLVHHAGAVPLDVLPVENHRRAVMWPPMTFGTERAPDWNALPMGVETDHEPLFQWAQELAPHAFRLTAESRPQLHLGAVLGGNLTAAWIGAVEMYLKAHALPGAVLRPLIEASVSKALTGNALDTVSGPASRNDRTTLDQQVKALGSSGANPPDFAEIHRLLTNLILSHHGHPTLPPIQAATGEH